MVVDRDTFARLVQFVNCIPLESARAIIDLVVANIEYSARHEESLRLKNFGQFDWDGEMLEFTLPKARLPKYRQLMSGKVPPDNVFANEPLFGQKCIKASNALGEFKPAIPGDWARVTAHRETNTRYKPFRIEVLMRSVLRIAMGLTTQCIGWSLTDKWYVQPEYVRHSNQSAEDAIYVPVLRYAWENTGS